MLRLHFSFDLLATSPNGSRWVLNTTQTDLDQHNYAYEGGGGGGAAPQDFSSGHIRAKKIIFGQKHSPPWLICGYNVVYIR